MTKQRLQKVNLKDGFTIIEVVLVLAIAGLIFLMVFIALPALQRSQRDTQRKDDIARLQSAINSYQANNRGSIPAAADWGDCEASALSGAIAQFCERYLLAENDVFNDPDGTTYVLNYCGAYDDAAGAAGGSCTSTGGGTGGGVTGGIISGNFASQAHNIYIFSQANCDGESAVASVGGSVNKLAILYKLEGGGVVCLNN
jgi:prepilin-type N-terminal cleavage/methylation domain-containing protein